MPDIECAICGKEAPEEGFFIIPFCEFHEARAKEKVTNNGSMRAFLNNHGIEYE